MVVLTTGMAAFLDCLQQFKEEVEKGDSGFHLPYDMEKGKIKDPSTGTRHPDSNILWLVFYLLNQCCVDIYLKYLILA